MIRQNTLEDPQKRKIDSQQHKPVKAFRENSKDVKPRTVISDVAQQRPVSSNKRAVQNQRPTSSYKGKIQQKEPQYQTTQEDQQQRQIGEEKKQDNKSSNMTLAQMMIKPESFKWEGNELDGQEKEKNSTISPMMIIQKDERDRFGVSPFKSPNKKPISSAQSNINLVQAMRKQEKQFQVLKINLSYRIKKSISELEIIQEEFVKNSYRASKLGDLVKASLNAALANKQHLERIDLSNHFIQNNIKFTAALKHLDDLVRQLDHESHLITDKLINQDSQKQDGESEQQNDGEIDSSMQQEHQVSDKKLLDDLNKERARNEELSKQIKELLERESFLLSQTKSESKKIEKANQIETEESTLNNTMSKSALLLNSQETEGDKKNWENVLNLMKKNQGTTHQTEIKKLKDEIESLNKQNSKLQKDYAMLERQLKQLSIKNEMLEKDKLSLSDLINEQRVFAKQQQLDIDSYKRKFRRSINYRGIDGVRQNRMEKDSLSQMNDSLENVSPNLSQNLSQLDRSRIRDNDQDLEKLKEEYETKIQNKNQKIQELIHQLNQLGKGILISDYIQ